MRTPQAPFPMTLLGRPRLLRIRRNATAFAWCDGYPIPLLLMVLLGFGCADPDVSLPGLESISIGGDVFHLEVAADQATRMQGLSDRQEIPLDGGMLFVFNETRVVSMVMRRCHIPIDVIFLDDFGRVVRTHRMQVEPDPDASDRNLKRYTSGDPARYAIELAGGSLDRLRIGIGDRIPIDVGRLRRMAHTLSP